MANKRANPLSGSFKSPPTTEESKEAAKAELKDKAGMLGNTGKSAEEKKPPEPPKDAKEQKACLIFSAFASSSPPVLDTSLSAVTMSWQYVAETIFNMLVLVALVKGAERIVKEMFGL